MCRHSQAAPAQGVEAWIERSRFAETGIAQSSAFMVTFGMEQAAPNKQQKRQGARRTARHTTRSTNGRKQKGPKSPTESQMQKPAQAKRSQNRSRRNDGISKSVMQNRKAAQLEDDRLSEADLTNVELKSLLDRALVRFGNWKVQIESNPNPKMVHSLKSIVSIIDTITSISERNMGYSYKDLSLQMSSLIEGVAQLNLLITGSLMEDDAIDEVEEKLINNQMMTVIQRTVELIRLVQQSFGMRNRLVDKTDKQE